MLYWAASKNKAAMTWTDYKQHLTSSGVDLTRKIFQRSLADLKGNYQSVEEKLRQLEVPTLILWGDSDPFFSVQIAKRIDEVIKTSEIRIYSSTGHFVPEERAENVAKDMRAFFEKHEISR